VHATSGGAPQTGPLLSWPLGAGCQRESATGQWLVEWRVCKKYKKWKKLKEREILAWWTKRKWNWSKLRIQSEVSRFQASVQRHLVAIEFSERENKAER